MCSLFILELSHPIPYTHDLQGTMLFNQTKRLRKSNWNFQAKGAKIEILLSPKKIDQGKLSTIAKLFWKHHFCGKHGWNFFVTLLKKHCKCKDSTLSQRKKFQGLFQDLNWLITINPFILRILKSTLLTVYIHFLWRKFFKLHCLSWAEVNKIPGLSRFPTTHTNSVKGKALVV